LEFSLFLGGFSWIADTQASGCENSFLDGDLNHSDKHAALLGSRLVNYFGETQFLDVTVAKDTYQRSIAQSLTCQDDLLDMSRLLRVATFVGDTLLVIMRRRELSSLHGALHWDFYGMKPRWPLQL